MRGAGHPRSISIHFLIFARYFICQIGKDVRKVSSNGFEMRPVFQHTLLVSLEYLRILHLLTLTQETFMTPVTGGQKTWCHSKTI